jgi:hypothetical protein
MNFETGTLKNKNAMGCVSLFVLVLVIVFHVFFFATTRDETLSTCTEGPVWVWLHFAFHAAICCF